MICLPCGHPLRLEGTKWAHDSGNWKTNICDLNGCICMNPTPGFRKYTCNKGHVYYAQDHQIRCRACMSIARQKIEAIN
ncbi:MAG: hypothetical protein KGH64_04510 [Candidatus Micrarchaeota archaeon]|nr:hypothetical protein [Candidatus Micrarchaeota archaeon]